MITNSSLTVYHKDGLDVATHFGLDITMIKCGSLVARVLE